MQETVEHIFDKLGGATKIARGTGFPVQTVHDWKANAGVIPHWRRRDVLEFAEREGKLDELSPEAIEYLQYSKRAAA